MLFLVKAELRGTYPLPPEQFLELVVKDLETEINYQKKGKILAQGAFAGGKGGYNIYDVESNEGLHTLISQLPLFPFCDWEIVPLVSYEKAVESTKQSLASIQASRK